MKEKLNIANVVTGSRIVFSVLILFCSAFSKWFYMLYFIAAFTDMIDGTIARKLNISSSFGAKLDTAADFVFVASVMVKILLAVCIPRWILIWIAVICVVKFFNLISSIVLYYRIVPIHAIMNKVTGFLLFLLPLSMGHGAWQIPKVQAVIVCSAATFAAIQEGHYIRIGKTIE